MSCFMPSNGGSMPRPSVAIIHALATHVIWNSGRLVARRPQIADVNKPTDGVKYVLADRWL
jgi:hypothetical protein